MNSTNELDLLRIQQSQAKAQVEKARKIERLLANPDFREVIVDGFCEKEVSRYLFASTNSAFKSEERKEYIERGRAGSFLRRWLDEQIADGAQKETSLATLNEAIEQYQREQVLGINVNQDLYDMENSSYAE